MVLLAFRYFRAKKKAATFVKIAVFFGVPDTIRLRRLSERRSNMRSKSATYRIPAVKAGILYGVPDTI